MRSEDASQNSCRSELRQHLRRYSRTFGDENRPFCDPTALIGAANVVAHARGSPAFRCCGWLFSFSGFCGLYLWPCIQTTSRGKTKSASFYDLSMYLHARSATLISQMLCSFDYGVFHSSRFTICYTCTSYSLFHAILFICSEAVIS